MILADQIEGLIGAPVVNLKRLSGGELSEVFLAELANGRSMVAKRAPTAKGEARMLKAVLATGCPAPEVLGSNRDLLLMTRLADGGHPDDAGWHAAGQAIRRLHSANGTEYGWSKDHAFGPINIPNAPTESWSAFWADQRLLAASRKIAPDLRRRLGVLSARLDTHLPANPRPALLHGDLWGGNVLFGPEGFSGVIDPAAYYGDREVDLAMLTLFGTPPNSFFDGYGGLPEGWQDRRPIYQLWPALVHLRLFGAGYRPMVERLLESVGA